MKKIYTTLALAALVCASASAVKPESLDKTVSGNVSRNDVTELSFVAENGIQKSAPEKAASVNDFTGFYTCDYTWALSGNDPGTVSATIKQISGNQVTIVFAPWTFAELVGTVDPAANTVTIATAANANLYQHAEYGTLFLGAYDIVPDPSDPTKGMRQAKDKIVGTLASNGDITFGGINEFIAYEWSAGGYNMGMRGVTMVTPDWFTYVPWHWETCGECTYKDDVVNPVFKDAYKVPASKAILQQSPKDRNLYLLNNPFAGEEWKVLNEKTGAEADGQIVMYITDRMVAVRPLVGTGFWLDMGEENAPDLVEMYYYNQEGTYVFMQDLDPDEVADVFEDEGWDMSYYDKATNTVHAVNMMFGDTDSPLAGYVWQSYKELSFDVIMPEGFEVGGVEGVTVDSNKGVKRMFNLQGMEVKSPKAGEVVIVKNGNMTYKTIAK